jgi:FkbM family methyltransferase
MALPPLATTSFSYAGHTYAYVHAAADPSGQGCLREIVQNDEYKLHRFRGASGSNGAAFLDIGANAGVVSLILGHQNPACKVYAYEPCPATYAVLCENVRRNGLSNVVPVHAAVGGPDAPPTLTLFKHPSYSGGNTTASTPEAFAAYFKKQTPSNAAVQVPCVSLDAVLRDHGGGGGIRHLHALKIDCEGAEYDALYGSRALATGACTVDHLIGEFHELSYGAAMPGGVAAAKERTPAALLAYCQSFVKHPISVTTLKL